MKSFILFITIMYSTSLFSVELNSSSNKINRTIFKELRKNFRQGIFLAAERYNSQRENKQYILSLYKRAKLAPNKSKLPNRLPKAIVKNFKLHIPEIHVTYSFENFLSHSFNLKNKKIKLNCKIKNECIYHFANSLTKANQTVFLNTFIAYANSGLMSKLNIDDYKLMTAVMAMDYEFKDISSVGAFGFGSDEEKLAIVKANLEKIFPKMNSLKNSCEDWKENKDLYGFNTYSDMFSAIKSILTLSDDNEFIDISEDKLGEEAFSYTGHEDSNSMFNNKRNWEKILTCQNTLGIKQVLDYSSDKLESDHTHQNAALKRSVALKAPSSITNLPTDITYLKKIYEKRMEEIKQETNNFDNSFFLNSADNFDSENERLTKKINQILRSIKKTSKKNDLSKGLLENMQKALPNKMAYKVIKNPTESTDSSSVFKKYKKLYVQHKVLQAFDSNDNNSPITSQGYCEVINKTKSCLDEYYANIQAAYNNDRLDSNTKDELEDLIDLDPSADIKGGKVISN